MKMLYIKCVTYTKYIYIYVSKYHILNISNIGMHENTIHELSDTHIHIYIGMHKSIVL